MAGRVQGIAQPADPAVHHVRRRDHIDAGLGLADRLAAEHFDGLVVQDPVAGKQPVMAMARIGIERDVADDAEPGKACFSARTARLHRLSGRQASAPSSPFSAGGTTGKIAIAGMPSSAASPAESISAWMDRRSTPGMLGSVSRAAAAFLNEDRPDEIIRVQAVLGHQPAYPVLARLRRRRMRG